MSRIILMGISHHGNIGDSAIVIAEKEILNNHFPEFEKYYVQERYLDVCAKKVKDFIKDDDIILLHAGGNIGDTYSIPERGRREVIKLFPNNKIIILPQTAYFSDTEKGREELERSKEIYNDHKKLVILARENKSYNFMKEHFYNAKVYLTPDIVMTLVRVSDKKRKGALFLLRTDREKVLEESKVKRIIEIINKKFESYKLSDMHLGEEVSNIGGNVRRKVLDNKFDEFQSSELVITDRLHGMIFAAITHTPCIAFGNFNHKVLESYRWLENLEYIKFCEDIGNIENDINSVMNANNISYDNTFAEETIVNILKREIN